MNGGLRLIGEQELTVFAASFQWTCKLPVYRSFDTLEQ